MKKLFFLLSLLILSSANSLADDNEEVYVEYNGVRFRRYEVSTFIHNYEYIGVYFALVEPAGGGQYSGNLVIPQEIPYHYEMTVNDGMVVDVTHKLVTDVGIVNVSECSFVNNTRITGIVYPESFQVFSCRGCTNLKSVTLPKIPLMVYDLGYDKIPNYGFKDCINLTMVKNLDTESYSKIPICAFENCKQLREIDLSRISEIGYSAFRGSGLETVKFSDNYESTIGRAAFAYCTKLRTAEFTKQFNMGGGNVGDSLFTGCSSLVSVKGFELLHNRDYSSSLRRAMFAGCSKLTDLTLASNIESIGVSAFEGCNNLRHIKGDFVIKGVRKRAFMDCWSLDKLPIDWKESRGYEDSTFYRCNNLDFGDILYIAKANSHTFGECFKLQKVFVTDALYGNRYEIGDSAFVDCHALTSFDYEGYYFSDRHYRSLKIGKGSFAGCSSLYQLKTWLDTVGKDGFNGCTSLSSIAFYNACYVCESRGYFIGEHAFQNCSNLNRITMFHPEITSDYLEDGRDILGNEAFAGCNMIKDIYLVFSYSVNESLSKYGNNLVDVIPQINEKTFMKEAYTNAYLHLVGTRPFPDFYKNAILGKGWSLFANIKTGHLEKNNVGELLSYDGKTYYHMENASLACYDNGDLKVPQEDNGHIVTKIATRAFKDNQWIESIHLPISIRRISGLAFDNCSNLKSIYVRRTKPIHFSNSLRHDKFKYNRPFEGVDYENVILYVPKDCGRAYKNANEWKRFTHIVETEDLGGYWKPSHDSPSSSSGSPIIEFYDELTEEICVANWDINESEFLSEYEATRVGSLDQKFKGTDITAFCELSYFTQISAFNPEEFAGCAYLDSICIPEKVNTIGEKAFDGCNSLKKVFTKIQNPQPFNNNVFTQTAYDHAWLVVPVGTVNTYKATAGWKNFKNIAEKGSEPEEIEDPVDPNEDNPNEDKPKEGDLTGDGNINGTDLVQLIEYVLTGKSDVKAADLNGDGVVNGTDLVMLVNMIMGK